MPLELEAVALTDAGRARDKNEDVAFQRVFDASNDDPIGLFVVADGIGGRLAGQVASFWAVEAVKNSLADLIAYQDPHATNRFSREDLLRMRGINVGEIDPDKLEGRVVKAVERANRAVREYARHRPEDARNAGTTLCLALVYGLQAIVANVGDSRAYLLRDGQLRQITRDHSVVQRLIDAGEVPAGERYTHPQRNLIYRSLGARDGVEPDIFALALAPGDRLLLCSDGLWEMVQDDAAMARIIGAATSLQAACQELVDAANAAGGQDNIGVALAQVALAD